jgi:hypothetical protein
MENDAQGVGKALEVKLEKDDHKPTCGKDAFRETGDSCFTQF